MQCRWCGTRSSEPLLILIITLSLVMVACPQAYRQIFFVDGNKTTERWKAKFLEDKVSLQIAGYTGSQVSNNPSIGLLMKLSYPKFEGNLSFHGDRIIVLLDDEPMIWCCPKCDSFDIEQTETSYKIEMVFKSANYGKDGTDGGKGTGRIKIVLNEFINYGAKALPIDTIYAILKR